ncbi:collagenase-like [Eurosta solidaginis]|uniref:collagenase-like n=1 Tax=Eurosta solidaginis TaxID=178769 RepID=UPI003530576F
MKSIIALSLLLCFASAILSVNVILGNTARSNAPLSFDVDSSKFILHAEFIAGNVFQDIALIRIPAVTYKNAIQFVRLPPRASSYPTYEGEIVVMAGWGHLTVASFKIISNEACTAAYGDSFIYSGKICTATITSVFTCAGDSGGALELTSSKIQVGIASFSTAE